MLAYKTTSKIDKNGNIHLSNLPYRNKKDVEIILLIREEQKRNVKTANQRIQQLKASFTSIKPTVKIDDELLRQEHLYSAER